MQHIAEVAQTALTARPSVGLTRSSALPSKWIAALFGKFAVRYGHKWTSAYPESLLAAAVQEWAEGLGGLTGQQLRRGLDMWDEDWPPSLSEFRKACLPSPEYRTAAYRPFPPMLPKPGADPDLVRREMAEAAEFLR